MNYCTSNNLIDRFGQDFFSQVSANEVSIEVAIKDATSKINMYIGKLIKNLCCNSVQSDDLTRLACDITRNYLMTNGNGSYYNYDNYNSPDGIPTGMPIWREQYLEAMKVLKDIAANKISVNLICYDNEGKETIINTSELIKSGGIRSVTYKDTSKCYDSYRSCDPIRGLNRC